jgi:hypothetical protein
MRILKILAVFYLYLPAFAQNQSVVDTFAVKPPRDGGLQYVAVSGSDSNDGLSWGTAKRTIFAACEARPPVAVERSITYPARRPIQLDVLGSG